MTSEDIKSAVCDEFNVGIAELVGRRRPARLCRPRFAAAYLLREMGKQKLSAIGADLGGRDHTTVLNGIHRAHHLIDTDDDFALRILRITDAVRGAQLVFKTTRTKT